MKSGFNVVITLNPDVDHFVTLRDCALLADIKDWKINDPDFNLTIM